MPESVKDRPTKAHEQIFLLSKSQQYFYNQDAVKEPVSSIARSREKQNGESAVETKQRGYGSHCGTYEDGRNKRSVWTVNTHPFSDAHFATFPPKLIEPCILAGSKTGDTILDPFGGSGTTGMVAIGFGRSAILIELNPEYIKLINQRCTVTQGLPL